MREQAKFFPVKTIFQVFLPNSSESSILNYMNRDEYDRKYLKLKELVDTVKLHCF